MSFGGNDHPFYKPLGVRLAIVAVTAAWAAFEILYSKDGFWSVIAGGVCAYAVYAFLIAYPKSQTPPGGS